MSRLVVGVLLVVLALVVLAAVLYRWFAARESTKQTKMRLEHEREMQRQEAKHEEHMELFDDEGKL